MDDYTQEHVGAWMEAINAPLETDFAFGILERGELSQRGIVELADDLGIGLPYVVAKLMCVNICPVREEDNVKFKRVGKAHLKEDAEAVVDSIFSTYVENYGEDWQVIPFITSTSVVVKAEGEVALIEKENHFAGQYVHLQLNGENTLEYFPGGMCEYRDASPKLSAAREVEEETGLKLNPHSLELLGVNLYREAVTLPDLGVNGVERDAFMPTYGCTLASRQELHASGDSKKAGWKDVNYVLERLPEKSDYLPVLEVKKFLVAGNGE